MTYARITTPLFMFGRSNVVPEVLQSISEIYCTMI